MWGHSKGYEESEKRLLVAFVTFTPKVKKRGVILEKTSTSTIGVTAESFEAQYNSRHFISRHLRPTTSMLLLHTKCVKFSHKF